MGGRSHGSDEFVRKVSESRMTGVRYLTAMRTASIAAAKQSDGVLEATLVRANTHTIELNKEDYVRQRPEVVAYLKTLLGS